MRRYVNGFFFFVFYCAQVPKDKTGLKGKSGGNWGA